MVDFNYYNPQLVIHRREFERTINRWAAPTAAIIPDSLMGHKGC